MASDNIPEDPTNDKIKIDGGWQRRGGCSHCSECCKSLGQITLDATPARKGEELDYYFLALRGLTLGLRKDGSLGAAKRIELQSPCPAYDDSKTGISGGCRIYAQRPRTCVEYPVGPEQVLHSQCSYWFERKTEDGKMERIGGKGSPHPGRTVSPVIVP